MGEDRWKGIIAILIIASLAAVFFAGYIFVTYSNMVEPSGTQSSLVGCTFEYNITGNYNDDYFYTGTEKQYIVEENSTSYKIRTTGELYLQSVKSGLLIPQEPYESEDWVYITALSSPGKFIGNDSINTYWGMQSVRDYVKSDDKSETTSFVGYTYVTMEKYIKKGDELKIYLLTDTDYILDKKVNTFGTYAITTTTYGTVTESTVQAVSGSTTIKQIDTTGTCYKKSYKESMTIGSEKKADSYTKWVVRSEDQPQYGVYFGTGTVSFSWGKVECRIYEYKDSGLTTHSYLYQDKVLLKSNTTGVSEGKKYEIYNSATELIVDNTAVNSLDSLNELCNMM